MQVNHQPFADGREHVWSILDRAKQIRFQQRTAAGSHIVSMTLLLFAFDALHNLFGGGIVQTYRLLFLIIDKTMRFVSFLERGADEVALDYSHAGYIGEDLRQRVAVGHPAGHAVAGTAFKR